MQSHLVVTASPYWIKTCFVGEESYLIQHEQNMFLHILNSFLIFISLLFQYAINQSLYNSLGSICNPSKLRTGIARQSMRKELFKAPILSEKKAILSSVDSFATTSSLYKYITY